MACCPGAREYNKACHQPDVFPDEDAAAALLSKTSSQMSQFEFLQLIRALPMLATAFHLQTVFYLSAVEADAVSSGILVTENKIIVG